MHFATLFAPLLLLVGALAAPTPTSDVALRLSGQMGQRVGPSPSSSMAPRRIKKSIISVTLPLGSADDLARCPSGFMACPIYNMEFEEAMSAMTDDVPYECVKPTEDLLSCGGCSTLGTGQDCTAIPGVSAVECRVGTCVALSCAAGWTLGANGHCVRGLTILS